ncbi:MAG: portal protein, partial [Syntrophales bacterium]|nr:portal protein [Syntrophales bacterium]
EDIEAKGFTIAQERTEQAHQVKWCKMNGAEVLEKADWAGKYIPIIPVLGDEIVVEGKKYYLSLARGAKGPQEMYNYHSTAATETIALAPKSPFMVDHRQIKGFENEWEEANTTNRMYIRYNAIAGLEKPQRERQTEVPSAIMAMMQQAAFDIEDHLGRYEATKGQKSNERSGKAILARIAQADKGTYTFVDNLTRAIVYAGRQIIDLIPKIYDTQRALTIMGEDGEQSIVQVNVPELDGMGNAGLANDLSVGKYDLIASVGASFGSKRQETVAMMLESMQYAPAIAHIISPLIFKYADFPGAQEIYAEIKTQVEKMQEGEQGGNKKGPK